MTLEKPLSTPHSINFEFHKTYNVSVDSTTFRQLD